MGREHLTAGRETSGICPCSLGATRSVQRAETYPVVSGKRGQTQGVNSKNEIEELLLYMKLKQHLQTLRNGLTIELSTVVL